MTDAINSTPPDETDWRAAGDWGQARGLDEASGIDGDEGDGAMKAMGR